MQAVYVRADLSPQLLNSCTLNTCTNQHAHCTLHALTSAPPLARCDSKVFPIDFGWLGCTAHSDPSAAQPEWCILACKVNQSPSQTMRILNRHLPIVQPWIVGGIVGGSQQNQQQLSMILWAQMVQLGRKNSMQRSLSARCLKVIKATPVHSWCAVAQYCWHAS